MFRSLGIRGRLLLSFLAISMFAVFAGLAALYSFLEVGTVLNRISKADAPIAIASLELSRQAEKIVRAAPITLTVANLGQLEQIRTQNKVELERLHQLLMHLKENHSNEKLLATIEWGVSQLRGNLEELHNIVTRQLRLRRGQEGLINEFRNSYSEIEQQLTDSISEIDRGLERPQSSVEVSSLGSESNRLTDPRLFELTASRRAIQFANQNIANIQSLFLETQLIDQPRQLANLSVRGRQLMGALDKSVQTLKPELFNNLKFHLEKLRTFFDGSNSIFAHLSSEFDVKNKARDILNDNAWLSEELSGAVDEHVGIAKQNISQAIDKATATQKFSTLIISVVVLASIIFSTLIVWLYVGRNLIARLTELSVCMESVAEGDLRVDLPSTASTDEIGRMTKALTVFRDTAVEIEESNLREIGQARQRLMEAIESISEGFCYYDSDDKLVVANNRYRAIMYPGMEKEIVEGMKFEAVIRNAAKKGFIRDAEGRIEEWVAERMERHHNPGPPHVQERGTGMWVMVSERKTSDGGTVAVYSDITDLKQREEELAKKSNSMEQLSNQIAKYLSPQIYDSIFTGKKEVKVSSHRRKLTVFFSDIAGFTETAEQMESEDLTKLLNHYLTEMSQIANVHGATIDKYVGDAIVIFFGDPESRGVKEDALACVEMAIEMRKKMSELQEFWRASGIVKPLQCRIGINTGFCTVGNFGSEDRMDYTIIGSGVNLASRLESAATPGAILIAFETYALVNDKIKCTKLGQMEVRGIAHPVETYQVVDSYENLGREKERIREESPKFNLKIDIGDMSSDERKQAISVLNSALERMNSVDERLLENS